MKKLASVGYTTRRMCPPRRSKVIKGQLFIEYPIVVKSYGVLVLVKCAPDGR